MANYKTRANPQRQQAAISGRDTAWRDARDEFEKFVGQAAESGK